MSKAKKKAARQQIPCEGKYEGICRDRQERDEFAVLNRKTRDRVDRMQQELWAKEAKAIYESIVLEKRVKALINLILLVIMCVVTCGAVIALAYTGAVAWWISALLIVGLMMTCSFRSGWLWHEIKK